MSDITPTSGPYPVARTGIDHLRHRLDQAHNKAEEAKRIGLRKLDYAAAPGVAGGNRLINCTFRTNQRAYASGSSLGMGGYGFDRWQAPGRQNLVLNPSLAVDATGVSAAAGTGSRVSTGGPTAGLPAFYRNTLTASQTVFTISTSSTTIPSSTIAQTQLYTPSAWVRCSVTTQLYVDYIDGAIDSPNNYVTVQANTWTRITGTPFYGNGSGSALIRVVRDTGAALPAGTTLDATGFMLTRGEKMVGYFDGDTSGCCWNGSRGYSVSWDRPEPPAVSNAIPNPSAETGLNNVTLSGTVTADTAWSQVGTKSFKINSGGSGNDSYISFGEQVALSTLGFQAGHTYTITGYARIGATIRSGTMVDATNDLRAGRIVFYALNGSTFLTVPAIVGVSNQYSAASAAIPNVANTVQRVQVTFTIPTNATNYYLRFYNGYQTGDIWWDALMVTEGTTVYPYFDGSTAPGGGYGYSWSGTVGGSYSTRSIDQSLTFTAAPQGQPVTLSAKGRIQQIVERANVPAGAYIAAHDGTAQMRVYNSSTTPDARPAFVTGPIALTLDGTDDVIVEFQGAGTVQSPRLYAGSTDFGPSLPILDLEIRACQRYYERQLSPSYVPVSVDAMSQGGTFGWASFAYAQKRLNPNLYLNGPLVVTDRTSYDLAFNGVTTDPHSGPQDYYCQVNHANGATVNRTFLLTGASGSTAAFAEFDAEIY